MRHRNDVLPRRDTRDLLAFFALAAGFAIALPAEFLTGRSHQHWIDGLVRWLNARWPA